MVFLNRPSSSKATTSLFLNFLKKNLLNRTHEAHVMSSPLYLLSTGHWCIVNKFVFSKGILWTPNKNGPLDHWSALSHDVLRLQLHGERHGANSNGNTFPFCIKLSISDWYRLVTWSKFSIFVKVKHTFFLPRSLKSVPVITVPVNALRVA